MTGSAHGSWLRLCLGRLGRVGRAAQLGADPARAVMERAGLRYARTMYLP